MRHNLTGIAASGLVALVLLGAGAAGAQDDYPNRPIRLIYGFPPGSDGGVRIIADKLSEALGKSVVVENVTGAAGGIATDRVAKATPDGYTLGVLSSSSLVINSNLYAKLSYDPLKDFAPITQMWRAPNLLVVNNDVPARTVQELIALARANPGTLTFGHSGLGTTQHLAGEIMKLVAKIDIQQVPYRGPPPIITDLLGGRISMSFVNTGALLRLVEEGKLRALAISSRERAAFIPQLPTMIEAGFPNFDTVPWFGLFAPAGTSQPIVERLNKEIARIVALPEVRKQFFDGGALMLSNTPEELAAIMKTETAYWAKIIKDAGIKPIE